jgi:cytochrome c
MPAGRAVGVNARTDGTVKLAGIRTPATTGSAPTIAFLGDSMIVKLLSPALAAAVLFAATPAHASMDLAKAKNCTACHAVDKKLIGPAYKDVAAKYASDKDATAKLAKKVREGGVGVWGQIPMPANPQVSADEATALVKWVLTAK